MAAVTQVRILVTACFVLFRIFLPFLNYQIKVSFLYVKSIQVCKNGF